MDNTLLYYFGTDLRQAGHYFHVVSVDHLASSKIFFKDIPFNPEELPRKELGNSSLRKGDVYYYHEHGFTICAIYGSCIDERFGTRSIFWVHRIIPFVDLTELILSHPIAVKMFKQMETEMKFSVKWPKPPESQEDIMMDLVSLAVSGHALNGSIRMTAQELSKRFSIKRK